MIPCIRLKTGTTLHPTPPPAGLHLLVALEGLARSIARDVVLSAGTNDHAGTDPHVLGLALDVSVREWPADVIVRAKKQLEAVLGSNFTVLYECPSMPSDPTLALIAYVNHEATAVHLHCQLSKHVPIWPVPDVPETHV